MCACPITQLASQLNPALFGSWRPWDRLWPVSSFVGNLTEALGPYVNCSPTVDDLKHRTPTGHLVGCTHTVVSEPVSYS